VFATFSDEPIAAASIGQVHAATLSGARDVVVKVRRPDIEAVVDLDLAILGRIARIVSRLSGRLRELDVAAFVDEFGATLRGELDYVAEGHNAERIRAELSAADLHVPEVAWTHTAPGVLTLERIHGAKIDDIAALDALGVDRQRVARIFADAYLSMVFLDGFYHADPHPGNLFVEASGRVALVDFGMIGTVTAGVRHGLIEILVALVTRDPQRSGKALRALGIVPSDVDEVRFATEMGRLTAATVDVAVGELKLAPLLVQFMSASRHHHLRFPRELALLVKTVVMCEGVAAQLDPHFSLASALGPFVADAVGSEADRSRRRR
jgi:ubiquinone biosynthesis protein